MGQWSSGRAGNCGKRCAWCVQQVQPSTRSSACVLINHLRSSVVSLYKRCPFHHCGRDWQMSSWLSSSTPLVSSATTEESSRRLPSRKHVKRRNVLRVPTWMRPAEMTYHSAQGHLRVGYRLKAYGFRVLHCLVQISQGLQSQANHQAQIYIRKHNRCLPTHQRTATSGGNGTKRPR